jgi:hypothetical protein
MAGPPARPGLLAAFVAFGDLPGSTPSFRYGLSPLKFRRGAGELSVGLDLSLC